MPDSAPRVRRWATNEEILDNVRIVVILRDPIERLESFYCHVLREGQASAKQVKAAGGWGGMEFFSKQNVTFESLWDDGLQMWQACSIADAPAFGWNHTRQNAWWCDNRLTNDPDTPWRRLFCCVEYQLNAVLIGAYKTQLEHWNIFFPLAHILVGLNVV